MSETTTRADIYQRITDHIVAAIEAGAAKYEMPWHGVDFAWHHNAASRRNYRGINTLVLATTAAARGYQSVEWATFKQWRELGAMVRKGERATSVVYWDVKIDEETQKRRMWAKAYAVFNADQVDGYTPRPRRARTMPERITHADTWFKALGADIRNGGSRAFYSPSHDFVQMPPYENFRYPIAYYSVLAHEITHWTGHANRCNRNLSGRFGDQSYAAEELIAELGAAYLSADLGLVSIPRPDHAAYVASWLKVLRNDKRAIFTAAAHAQRAADWLHAKAGLPELPDGGGDDDGGEPAPIEPDAEPEAEPVAAPVAEAVAEPVAAPIAEPIAAPVAEKVAKPGRRGKARGAKPAAPAAAVCGTRLTGKQAEFDRAYAAAKMAAVAVHGARWMFDPAACLGMASFPAALCASRKVAGSTLRSARQGHMPRPEFWPGGSIPHVTTLRITPHGPVETGAVRPVEPAKLGLVVREEIITLRDKDGHVRKFTSTYLASE